MTYPEGTELKIKFYDHASTSPEWHYLQYIAKYPVPEGEVKGYLVFEDDTTYRLATMILRDKKGKITEMGSCHIIIKGAVISIEKI